MTQLQPMKRLSSFWHLIILGNSRFQIPLPTNNIAIPRWFLKPYLVLLESKTAKYRRPNPSFTPHSIFHAELPLNLPRTHFCHQHGSNGTSKEWSVGRRMGVQRELDSNCVPSKETLSYRFKAQMAARGFSARYLTISSRTDIWPLVLISYQ